MHDKGMDCARTDEVLANYRRRAIAAETELARLRVAETNKEEDR